MDDLVELVKERLVSLEKENFLLREALERIAALCPDPEFGSYAIEEAKKIARAAILGEDLE
jgi:hypothetical protein